MPNEKNPRAKQKQSTIFEEAWRSHPIGYPRLAERMGVKPETLIFRKFIALNARMLLYMQAELVVLEAQLQHAESKSNQDQHGKRHHYATSFRCLLQSFKDGDTAQLDLVLKIQAKMKAYSGLFLGNIM
jgi:hypothetical protein